MKKLNILSLLFVGLLPFMAACDDDRDSNPTIQKPTTFVMNTPAYSSDINLETSKTLHFTCSQPNYGYTAAVTYKLQISLTNSFTVSVDQAEADEEGLLVADYAEIDESYSSCDIYTDASLFSKAVMQLAQWSADAVPATQDVYTRLLATVDAYSVTSNVVTINVIPYYIELSDAPVEMWYLIGSCIGDGKWSNNTDNIGISLYPMSTVKDYEYNKKDGTGELTFTGWLTPDGFKLIKVPGSWDEQWGMTDGAFVKNDGGSSNITVAAAGYYTITLNTKDNKMSIVPAEITPKVYDSICMSGGFNDWSDTPMTAVNTTVENNHIWSAIYESGGEVKFKIAGSWDTNWGSSEFPNGHGVGNGDNIAVPDGKWAVVFNDIDGSYTFTAL